ncbi:hypothetical protein [Isoptericola sp. NPDC057191]|uniref:hypothetical protein n=1 Tax=Isoptericola sp. NPDC057191 TaxID=3346041 RepID=UPI00362A4FB4
MATHVTRSTTKPFDRVPLDQSRSDAAVRGQEKRLIEHFWEQDVLANAINAVSLLNPQLQMYMESAWNEVGGP